MENKKNNSKKVPKLKELKDKPDFSPNNPFSPANAKSKGGRVNTNRPTLDDYDRWDK